MQTNSGAMLFDVLMRHDSVLLFLIFMASCGVMLLVGNPMIAWIKNLRGMKWSAREDTPDSHLKKSGTPSMGGIGIIGAALFSVLGAASLYAVFTLRSGITASGRRATGASTAVDFVETCAFLLFVASFMLLGLADDWSKARGKGGLRARDKFALQLVLSLAFLAYWSYVLVLVPSGFRVGMNWTELAWLIVPFLIFLIGTSNAVNLTDGIDGLAAGLTSIAGISLAVCNIGYFYDPSWLAVALAGSCVGFLAFNKYPARVFMGDTGSLALGAALGIIAVLSGTVWLMPFVGFIFYVEMFSVIFQVAWFKYTKKKFGEGRRLLRRAPLHHHYELAGWSERRVVVTFWAINTATSLLGLLLWYWKIIPHWPNY